ncbi:MAG: RNase P modulator RnpM [Acutalibacteraceae bacterium]
MTNKKIPMRKCLGCMEMKPKRDLVRVVKTKTGEADGEETYTISLDKKGKAAGRGAYICKNVECLKNAQKAKRFEKNLQCKIPDEIFSKMLTEIEEDE